eukprot:TRINITY_DN1595_c0_g2_i4.p1 TRINITY_DN1595_c0_g2~~TRINITY_DN1595_c0_g2_i4.p1  ORF type:complete len:520 (-),score=51.27 TRINITY_DN1595_c0_g2_i4:153-1712(-)
MTDTEEISCGDVLLLSQENVHQIVNLVDESACKIKHLVISNAKICQLPQDVCSCHWIQTLELKQNQITTLGDLSPLTMLTRLIVDEPLLPKDELLFWSKYIFPIRKLDLSWMRLTSVPDIIFKIVPTMRFPLLNIDLSDNSISQLPDLLSLTSLENVSLIGNRLHPAAHIFWSSYRIRCGTLIIKSVEDAKQVRIYLKESDHLSPHILRFALSSTKLKSIPPGVFHLANLSSLHLDKNRITGLSPEISTLGKLQFLDVSSNKISVLPPEISGLTSLVHLIAGVNEITHLPEEITCLRQLRLLDLFKNQLSGLPEYVGRLTRLESVDLEGNKLSKIPQSFGRLHNLTTVRLALNKIRDFPVVLTRLQNLACLSISVSSACDSLSEIGKMTNLVQLSVTREHKLAEDRGEDTLPRGLVAEDETMVPDLRNLSRLDSLHLHIFDSFLFSRLSLAYKPGGVLDFSQLGLDSIPKLVCKLPIRCLIICNNKISAFPAFLCDMPLLESIDARETEVIKQTRMPKR